MPRQKRPTYEYVERLKRYRKRIKDADGKYVSVYGKTPQELEEKLEAARAVISAGLDVRENPTVAQYAQQWLPGATAEMGTKYKEDYEKAVRLHIVPVIGHLTLREVRPDDARAVMTELAGKSNSLQSKVLATMKALFENAVDNDIIPKNPAAKLKAGGKKTEKKTPLTEKQVEVLKDAVCGTRAETFVLLALATGMRREELLALTWDNVDLQKNAPHVNVRQALRWEHNQPKVSSILKTEAAWRTIPISDEMKSHLDKQKSKSGFVFGGTAPLTESRFRRLWAAVEARQTGPKTYTGYDKDGKKQKVTFVRKLGAKSRGGNWKYTIDFDVHPHLLRHTYITNLILGGVNIKRVQYLAGHSDIKFTLEIYTNLVENSPEAIREELKKLWG